MDTTIDTPQAEERCTCGRAAALVYVTDQHGRVPYCGIPDGGGARGNDHEATDQQR